VEASAPAEAPQPAARPSVSDEEKARKRAGAPHYWNEDAFGTALRATGFTVLAMRPTFLHGSSLLAFVRKDTEG
jgi:hypothetical protein